MPKSKNMEKQLSKNKGSKNRKRVLTVIGVLICLVLVLPGVGYGIFYHYFSLMEQIDTDTADSSAWTELDDDGDTENTAPPATDEEINAIEKELHQNLEEIEANSQLYTTDAFNILLVGVDSREDSFSGRSDSMILVSINKNTKEVTLTSFLRDTYVTIPGYINNRLNAAYAFGGTDLLTETIKTNYGISVDRCIVLNFYLVMDLVDAVGGIDLDLSADEIRVMNNYINSQDKLLGNSEITDILPKSSAGIVHVNGNQALAYARVRYIGTDFARTDRQRTVINKCIEKIKQMDLGEVMGLSEKFLPRVQTNLTKGDCAALLLMALNLSDYKFQSLALPVDGTWKYANIRGMSVIIADFAANVEVWHKVMETET